VIGEKDSETEIVAILTHIERKKNELKRDKEKSNEHIHYQRGS